MNAEQLILRILLDASSVTQIVNERIYIGDVPQGFAAPYLLLNPLWEQAEYHTPGFASAYSSRTQIDCIAKGSLASIDLSSAVRDTLVDLQNVAVFNREVPPERMGTITLWKLGTALHDTGEDRQYHRRILEFRSRWQP